MMKKKIISMVLVLTMASNPFVGLAPFYVAMDKGFFKDCGLDFSMVDFDDSSASCSALLAGKVDLAYTTLDAAIIAESQYEEDMLDVTAIVDESAGADGILVKNDINSIADLTLSADAGAGDGRSYRCRCRSCQYDIFGCRSIFYQR